MWFLLVLLLAISSHGAKASQSPCPNFVGKLKQALSQYSSELKKDDGSVQWRRFVLKPAQSDEAKKKWAGFLTQYEAPEQLRLYHVTPAQMLDRIYRTLSPGKRPPQYLLSPLSGMQYNLVTRPIRHVTSKLFKQELDPTLWVSVPAGLYFSNWVWNQVDAQYDKALKNQLLTQIEDHSKEYDALIAEDYRFNDIKRHLLAHEMTPEKARQSAYVYQKLIHEYFEYIRGEAKTEGREKLRETLLSHPLFSDISTVAAQGIPDLGQRYRKLSGFQKNLSQVQVDELLEIRMGLEQRLQVISLANKGDALPSDIQLDPFASYLLDLRKKGAITLPQLIYRLQEDASWSARFQAEDVMRIQKLTNDEGKKPHPVTIEEIRSETLQELASQKTI